MYYFIFTDTSKTFLDRIIDADESPAAYSQMEFIGWARVETSNEFKHTWERVVDIARAATALSEYTFIPVDRGTSTSPRFSVAKVPQVGDKVSYAFNGDSYPCGEITKISKSFRRIETSEGKVFFRRRLSAQWVNGKTWSLVKGHVSTRNPHF